MIELTCNQCQETLRIDDGFAGGVCRCRHCGTIQTVPKRLAGNADAAATPRPQPRPMGGKVLHRPAGSGTGLEALGEAVTSSGLHAGRLRQSPRPAAAETAPVVEVKRGMPPWVWAVIGAGVAVPAILMGLMLLWSTGSEPIPPATFLGDPVAAETTIYVVDRGQSTADHLRHIRRAIMAAADEDKRLQVVFATADGPSVVFPVGPSHPTQATLRLLDEQFNTADGGSTDLLAALTRAADDAEGDPDARLVLLTGKAWQLPATFAADALRHVDAPIDVVAIGGDSLDGVAEQLAVSSGGRFRSLTPAELADLASTASRSTTP